MKQVTSMADFRCFDEFDGHEAIVGFTDQTSGLKGYIGIHNTTLGPALGGTRCISYDSETLALRDVLNLSRAMSYKCALAKLPFGGGKGVIMLEAGMQRDAALAAYARTVENLRGYFKTGTDVGISDKDVAMMGRQTKHMLGLTEADRSDLTTGNCAALGVFYTMKAAMSHLDGSSELAGKRVAIKGVGKLGGELARLLHAAKADIIIADTDETAVQKILASLPGIHVVSVDDIHRQVVDIYAPCALGNEFSDSITDQLQTRAIVGGANNQLATIASGDQIHARGILYAPDYIANAGGLIYVADELEPTGFNKERVLSRVEQIQITALSIFERAKTDGLPTYAIADTMARERISGTR